VAQALLPAHVSQSREFRGSHERRDDRFLRFFKFEQYCSSEAWMAATKITVNSNGSIRVEGDFEVLDPQGQPFGLAGRTSIGLCRCGHSATKPFCDGSHKTTGFNHEVVARELPPPKPKV
jgi:CDGSH-type Zn-finger protein